MTITIKQTDESGVLTQAERWEIIQAAAIACRAAIDQYINPTERQKARNAIAAMMSATHIPALIKSTEYLVPQNEDDHG